MELHLNVMNAAYTVQSEEPLDAYRDYGLQPHLKQRAVVHLFCRDTEGKRHVIRDWRGTFKPYFYGPTRKDNKEGQHDFFGRWVKRVETTLPGDVPNERAKYNFTDEAAILFEKRFQIDYNIYCGLKVRKEGDSPAVIQSAEPLDVQPRFIFYDIEVAAKGDLSVQDANYPVVLITSIDSYTNKITLHAQRPPNMKVKEIKVITQQLAKEWKERGYKLELIDCPNEFQTINMWAQFIDDIDPDVLVAHNGDRFDFPYLFYRCRTKQWRGIFRKLSPMKKAYMRGEYPFIKGRQHIDFCGAKARRDGFYTNFTVQDTDVDSLRLEELAEVELSYSYKFGKIGYLTLDMWYSDDPKELFKLWYYGAEDVWVMIAIFKKKGMDVRYETLRRIFGCTLKDTLSNQAFIDIGCLRLAEAPLPTKIGRSYDKKKKKQIEGALVIRPQVGMHGEMKE